jgi:hypothetical protein
MKKVLFAAVVTAALVFQLSCKPKGGGSSGNENTYVYSFAEAGVLSADDSKKMVEKFLGTTDTEPLYKSEENTVYFTSKDDVTATFEQDLNTGNFTFNKGMKKYMGDYAPRLPSKDAAINATEDFLSKNELLPKDKSQLKLVHFGGIRSNWVIDGQKAGPVTDKLITVTYGRVVDGLPVIGPGSKLVANVGEEGAIVGLVHRWRELDAQSRKQVQREEMLSQQEAEEMARRQIQQEYGQDISYKILGSGKAYYDNNRKILQPVYIFETEIKVKDEHVKPFTYLCVIQMLKQSPEPLQLTAVDPKAKELIKSIKRGEQVPGAPEKDADD